MPDTLRMTTEFRSRRVSALPAPIQAEKDRAESGGATIEDGVYTDLIQPVYDVLDGAGVWSDVVFFGVAGVRDVVSGSVATLYDQSGNQNDATQGTTSARPTVVSDLTGGKDAVRYDGTDDFLSTSTASKSQPNSVFSLLDRKGNRSASWDGNTSRGWHLFNTNNSEIFAGTILSLNNRYSAGLRFWTAIYNGTNSEAIVDGTSDVTGDAGTNDAEDILLGRNQPSTNFTNDDALVYLFVNTKFSSSVRSDLRSICTDYYSL